MPNECTKSEARYKADKMYFDAALDLMTTGVKTDLLRFGELAGNMFSNSGGVHGGWIPLTNDDVTNLQNLNDTTIRIIDGKAFKFRPELPTEIWAQIFAFFSSDDSLGYAAPSEQGVNDLVGSVAKGFNDHDELCSIQ